MARIRTIKPEFWSSERLGTRLQGPEGRQARLLFVALWTHAEDHGACKGAPAYLKAAAFPYDEDITTGDVRRWLDLLESGGFVVRYQRDGSQYVWIRGFAEHQKIDRPGKTTIPTPSVEEVEGRAKTQRALDDDSTNARRMLDEASSQEWKGMEWSGSVPEPLSGSEPRPHVSDISAEPLPDAADEGFVPPQTPVVPKGSGDHPAGPESSPMPAESPETARHATNGATPMPTPPPLVLVAQKAAKAVRQRKPSAAERLYLQLEETRRQRCEESGVAFVPEDWAPARQNTSLGRFAKLEPPDQERFEAAWAEYLSDDSGAARNPPWSVGWFIASKSTWESRALRGAS